MAVSTLNAYGYLTTKVQEKNGSMVASEAVALGSPLMAIPLSQCWTKARAAEECWPVAKALLEASARNPGSALLQSDCTWISLHLIFDRRSPNGARKIFLEKLPKDLPRIPLTSEFATLSLELGSDVASFLDLDLESYSWAKSVLHRYGMIFAGSNAERTEVLVPGVELFKIDSDVPSPSDVRLETSVADFNEATVVIYARKAYGTGAEVAFSSIKSYKASGVPLVVNMPYAENAIGVMESLCQLLAGSIVTPAAGDACPAESVVPVQVINEDGKSLIRVTMTLTLEKPLPSRDVTSLLGIGMLSDPDVLKKCYEEEANIPGVLEEDQCDKRALKLIQPDLVQMMAKADEDARKILTSAISELEQRVKAPPMLKDLWRAKPVKELIAVSPSASKSVQWPIDVDKTIVMLQAYVKDFQAIEQKFKNNATSQAAHLELQVAQSCLGSLYFGDPASVGLPEFDSTSPIVKAYVEVAKAELKALAASSEHESKTGATGVIKSKALCSRGSIQMRMNDFSAALVSFQKSLELALSPSVLSMVLEAALAHAAVKLPPRQLTPTSDALPLMKKVLMKMGYMEVAVATPERLPTSLPSALASSEMGAGSILAQAFSNSCDVPEVVDLVRIFMLHKPLPVKKARLLLGAKVCSMLLESSYLICFNPMTAKFLTPAEANLLMTSPKSRGAELIFSNIALQPTASGLLVASDFDYGAPAGFQAVPYFAQDSAALVASASALPPLSGKLVSSSSIAGGLTALAGDASVVFKGSDRFMTLARFSAGLNGFGKVSESNGPYDVIISSAVSLPNPANVIGNKGPMFKGWSDDLWSKCLVEDAAHLAQGGLLLVTTLVANSDSFGKTLPSPLSKGYQLAVFPSKPSGVEDLLRYVSSGCSSIHQYAYLEGLLKAGILTTSEVVMLLRKRPEASAKESAVEILSESKSSWADVACLEASVQKAHDSMCFVQEVQNMSPTDSIYDFSWDDDEGSTTASDIAGEESTKASLPISSPWEPKMAMRKSLKKKIEAAERPQSAAGAFWKEVGTCHALGWAPPINIYSTWRICPRPQIVTVMPEQMPNMAVVEIQGITAPSYLMDALRDAFDVKTKYAFDGDTKEFSAVSAGRSSRRRRRGMVDDDEVKIPFSSCPIIIVPMPAGSYEGGRIVDLPIQMLPFMQAIADRVRMGEKLIIIFLTCNAFGPMLEHHSHTVSMMGSLTGMCRTVRLEVKGFNVLNVDSDEFMPGGDAMELMAQLSLELLAPDYNAEVCWRSGKRYIRSFEYSARNPIRGTAPLPMISWVDDCPDGVAFITGGTGGLGVCSALSFAKAGCKKIVLCSRKGVLADQPGLKEMIGEIEAMPGVTVLMEKCDTSSETDVIAALERTRKNVGPLKIIVHAAGVLNDQIIDFQTPATMEFSFLPKSDGAWFLHKHSLNDPIESFVCFSSVSSLLGNPGQFNYASANAYMDTLCRWRCHHGLPACALMWPAVFGIGMAAATILKGAEYNEVEQVNSDVVEAVMRQVCCQQFPLEPLVAVCPMAILYPSFPAQSLALEPLYTKYKDQQAFDAAMKSLAESGQEKAVVKSSGVLH